MVERWKMNNIITLNEKSFSIIKLLGKGKGGYSYLVSDGKNEYVLKQIHYEPCDYYKFGNKLISELSDYRKLQKIGIPIPQMIEFDSKNERILKEYIEGPSIYELVVQDKISKEYLQQIKSICKLLYVANINIDYFPTNFIVRNSKLFYIDYECNEYSPEWNFEKWGIKYWSKTDDFLNYYNTHKN